MAKWYNTYTSYQLYKTWVYAWFILFCQHRKINWLWEIIIHLITYRITERYLFESVFFSRPQATFHSLMIFLAIWDLSFLVIAICFFALPELSRDYFNNFYLLMVPYGLPIGQILLTGSIYSTLALTVERWVQFKFKINHHVYFSK